MDKLQREIDEALDRLEESSPSVVKKDDGEGTNVKLDDDEHPSRPNNSCSEAESSTGISRMVEDFSSQLLERSASLRLENEALLQKIADLSQQAEAAAKKGCCCPFCSTVLKSSGEVVGDVIAAWLANPSSGGTELRFRKDADGMLLLVGPAPSVPEAHPESQQNGAIDDTTVHSKLPAAVVVPSAKGLAAAPLAQGRKASTSPAAGIRKTAAAPQPAPKPGARPVGSTRPSGSHPSVAPVAVSVKSVPASTAPKRSTTPTMSLRPKTAIAVPEAKTPPVTRSTTPVPTAGRRSVTPPAASRGPVAPAAVVGGNKAEAPARKMPNIPPLRVPAKSPSRQGPLAPRAQPAPKR